MEYNNTFSFNLNYMYNSCLLLYSIIVLNKLFCIQFIIHNS